MIRAHTAALAASIDLATWTEVALPGAGSLLGLASFRDKVVLVTSTPDPAGGADRFTVYVAAGLPSGS